MTKGQFIEQVFLAVSGGRLNEEISVHREDIENLMGAALADTLDTYIRRRKQEDRAEFRAFGSGGVDVYVSQFIATYEVTPTEDSTRGLYKVELPVPALAIGSNDGINELAPIQGDPYVKVGSRTVIAGIPDNTGVTFYWPEKVNGSQFLFIKGIGLPICSHLLKIVSDASQIGDDDEIPTSEAIQFRAIAALTEFFLNQRQLPEDTQLNDQDNIHANR